MKKKQFNKLKEDFVERVDRKKQEKMTTVKKEKICFTETDRQTDRQTDRNKEMCNITTLIRDSCIDKQKQRQRLLCISTSDRTPFAGRNCKVA